MTTIDAYIDAFFEDTQDTDLAIFHDALREQLGEYYSQRKHGRKPEWDEAIGSLPQTTTMDYSLTQDAVRIGTSDQLGGPDSQQLESILKQFLPWRKGPFQFFNQHIDTEWRSDWKWNRIRPHITDLKDRQVLDVGCGNGYHLFRMLGEGAAMACGIDPTRLFLYQFHLARHFLPELPAYILPLRSEHLPAFNQFDTVFSLGVLYHRRSPVDHLTELMSFLRPGGELVIETLVVDGDENTILVPKDRYAKMANVWFIPSAKALENLIRKVGFNDVRTVDINITSTEEQRATDWMTFHSLSDFLDPQDPSKTAEGYPAPLRATLVATKPNK